MAIASFVLLACSWLALGATQKPSLREGKVIAAALNGHGALNDKNKREPSSRRDVWWNYIIESGNQIYSVVSRENPAKTGLALNASLKFYEAKNWIYIPRSKGKPTSLKILNKSKKSSSTPVYPPNGNR